MDGAPGLPRGPGFDLEDVWGSSFISVKAFYVTVQCCEAPALIYWVSYPQAVQSHPHLLLYAFDLVFLRSHFLL